VNRNIQNIILFGIFILSFALIVIGQKDTGYTGLSMEIIGLFGLIGILYTYNKRYK